MSITLPKNDYATAWRLIAATSSHDNNIADVILSKVLPGLEHEPTLLDVGAGSGAVSRRLAPHFGHMTLVEQNADQIATGQAELDDLGATVFNGAFADFSSADKFDVVLCSHVFYHVPRAEWSDFIDRLLGFVRPGGVCVVVLVGGPTDGAGHPLSALPPEHRPQQLPHTTHDALRKDFSDDAVNTDMFVAELRSKDVPYELVSTINTWDARTIEEMYAICRFVVFEDCLTPEQVAAMTGEQARALDAKIRGHAAACPYTDEMYHLEMEDGVVIITSR
ncbi:MAG: class I SAM-dependent methyltransferase [Kibdelosporangium sp.]